MSTDLGILRLPEEPVEQLKTLLELADREIEDVSDARFVAASIYNALSILSKLLVNNDIGEDAIDDKTLEYISSRLVDVYNFLRSSCNNVISFKCRVAQDALQQVFNLIGKSGALIGLYVNRVLEKLERGEYERAASILRGVLLSDASAGPIVSTLLSRIRDATLRKARSVEDYDRAISTFDRVYKLLYILFEEAEDRNTKKVLSDALAEVKKSREEAEAAKLSLLSQEYNDKVSKVQMLLSEAENIVSTILSLKVTNPGFCGA